MEDILHILWFTWIVVSSAVTVLFFIMLFIVGIDCKGRREAEKDGN